MASSIDVETIPHGAAVALDAIPLAEPKVVLSLADAHPHDIVARAGCRQAAAQMTAAQLASFKGPLVLELAPRREDVLVGSEPSGARIDLNGQDTGKVTPAAVTIAGCEARDSTRAFAANRSNDEVMRVGRQRVTPRSRIRSSASATRSAVRSGALKSMPPKPFT